MNTMNTMNTDMTSESTMTNRHELLRWMVALWLLAGCQSQPAHDEHAQEAAHDDHDEPGPGGMVRVSKAGLERSGIQTEPVRLERLVGGIDVPAEVQLNPNRTAHITPMVAGRINKVYVSLGDSVKTKQALATMRSVALGEARSPVTNARAAVDALHQHDQAALPALHDARTVGPL